MQIAKSHGSHGLHHLPVKIFHQICPESFLSLSQAFFIHIKKNLFMNSSRNLLILFFLLFSQYSITRNDKLVKIQRKCSTFSLHKYFSCFIWETNLKLQIQFPLSAQQCLRFSFTIFNIEELFSVGFAFF